MIDTRKSVLQRGHVLDVLKRFGLGLKILCKNYFDLTNGIAYKISEISSVKTSVQLHICGALVSKNK